METSKTEFVKTYRSNEAIDIVLSAIGLTRESLSTYKEYETINGGYVRLRVSNHGIFLQNWFDANKEKRAETPSTPKLNVGQNLAITFAPNEEECKELNIPFPPKIKNVTAAKTNAGNNVKPQFSVRHIAYYTWKLSDDDINNISAAVSTCITNGSSYSEPLNDNSKYVEWEDTSNLPPKKITESKTNKNMKNTIKLNESQLRKVIAESVKKALNEGYNKTKTQELAETIGKKIDEITNLVQLDFANALLADYGKGSEEYTKGMEIRSKMINLASDLKGELWQHFQHYDFDYERIGY